MKRNIRAAIAMVGIVGFMGGAYVAQDNYFTHEVMANTVTAESYDSKIELSGSTATVSGSGAKVSSNVVTISQAGTYVLSGNASNVQVVVNAPEADVKILLNGVTLSNDSDAPIYVQDAKDVTISLVDGTVNTLSDKASSVELTDENKREASAVIYSTSDLKINGEGKLVINANYNNGIASKDDLKITSGNYVINAANHGMVGKDSIEIKNGTFDITAGSDGFQSDNTEVDKGYVTIENGKFDITSANDAIQAESKLTINNGTFTVETNGGAASNTQTQGNQMGQGGMGMGRTDMTGTTGTTTGTTGTTPPEIPGEMQFDAEGRPTGGPGGQTPTGTPGSIAPEIPEMQFDANGKPVGGPGGQAPTGATGVDASTSATATTTGKATGTTSTTTGKTTTTNTTTEEDTTSDSYKGLKAADIEINGGTFTLNTYDDSIKASNDVTINSGTFTLSAGEDAIQAENALTINDGTLDVLTSNEGLEGFKVVINGGDINVVASDDGINASSDTTTSKSSTYNEATTPAIIVNDGKVVISAGADGLDSNGALFLNGGDVQVAVANSNVETQIDLDGGLAEVDGGTLVATGGSSNMAVSFATSSIQNSFLHFFSTTMEAGKTLQLLDSKGNVVLTYEPTKAYSSVTISSPDLVAGQTYTLTNGTTKETVTLSSTSTVTKSGTTANAGMGGGKGTRTTTTTTTGTTTTK